MTTALGSIFRAQLSRKEPPKKNDRRRENGPRRELLRISLTKLSEKSRRHPNAAPQGTEAALFGPFLTPLYRPNRRPKRRSHPFRTVSTKSRANSVWPHSGSPSRVGAMIQPQGMSVGHPNSTRLPGDGASLSSLS